VKTYNGVSLVALGSSALDCADLPTPIMLASMYALALLSLANAMGGWSICDRHCGVRLRAWAHVLSSHHVGVGSKLLRFRRRRKGRDGRRVQYRDDVVWIDALWGSPGHPVQKGWRGERVYKRYIALVYRSCQEPVKDNRESAEGRKK